MWGEKALGGKGGKGTQPEKRGRIFGRKREKISGGEKALRSQGGEGLRGERGKEKGG